MYGKYFSKKSKKIGAKMNWFTFRRKLEYAKKPIRRRLTSAYYFRRVVPQIRKFSRQVRKSYGRGFQRNWKPSKLLGRR